MTNEVTSPFGQVSIPEISLYEFLIEKFQLYGSSEALILANDGRKILFSDVCKMAERISVKFRSMGVREKSVVSVCARNLPEYIYAMLGVLKLGAIWAPVNPKCSQEELNHNYSLTKPDFVITEQIFEERVRAAYEKTKYGKTIMIIDQEQRGLSFDSIPSTESEKEVASLRRIDVNQPAFYLSSSGTTGLPKIVVLTHKNVVSNLTQMLHKATFNEMETYHPQPGAPYIHVYPFFHSGGLIFSTLWPLCEGSHLVLLPEYDSNLFLEASETCQPELFIGPPPVLVHMTKSDEARDKNLSSFKAIISGAMPVSHELKNAVCEKFRVPYILEGYGLTEASPMTHMMPIAAISGGKLGSCGVLIPGTKAKIADVDSQAALAADCLGELCIYGPQVMSGYLNNLEATSATIDQDGWLHTGDLAYYDDQGFFYVIDRLKDLITCGGHKVDAGTYLHCSLNSSEFAAMLIHCSRHLRISLDQIAPADLEHILIMHDTVKDVAVVGIPDGEYGQVPLAFVVPKEGISIDDKTIIAYVRGKVPDFKNLRGGVKFVDSIPRAASGKILRRMLKG